MLQWRNGRMGGIGGRAVLAVGRIDCSLTRELPPYRRVVGCWVGDRRVVLG
jgi:hypothetical protein